MKKWSMMILAALCLALPSAAGAQELEQLFDAVGEGLVQGLEEGARAAEQSLREDLTLSLSASAERIEAGQRVTLSMTAGNPRAQETPVELTLRLPERLGSDEALVIPVVLPPAQMDEQTGALVPSQTTVTREIAIVSGGESERVQLECEMDMGTRFYRARTELEICMADVSVSAEALGTQDGRLQPGGSFTYRIAIENAGAAAKELAVEMTLPAGMAVCGALPAGLTSGGQRIAGKVTAAAAQGSEPFEMQLDIPVAVAEDALEGDSDAQAVLGGVLRVGGERIALPRVQVVAPRVSAKLIPGADSIAAGEEMDMEILVVNTGLAAADVQVTCRLPEGFELAMPEAEGGAEKRAEATGDEADREEKPVAAVLPSDDGGPDGAAAPVEITTQEDGAIVCRLQMDAAADTGAGVSAATETIALRVRAMEDESVSEDRLVGASLLCSTDGGDGVLSEAVVLRVYRPAFLGLSGAEWNAVFWAALLMIATVSCLYAAVRSDKRKDRMDEYVFD